MARKPSTAPKSKETAIVPGTLEADTAAINALAAIELSKQDYGQGRDLVNQLLGQAQAFQAAGNLLQTFGVSKLAIVKENKLYQQLRGARAPNGLELTGTWVEFCELLGVSDEKANQDIQNLHAFGEAALEQMQRAGVGYRELRQFRRLPTDQKTELIEAAKAGDTTTLLELAEDLMAKHQREKEDLKKDLAAKDQRIARHTARITELEEAQDRWDALPLHEQVATSASRALGLVQGELRQSFVKLAEHHAEACDGSDSRQLMAGHVAQLQQLLNELRQEFALPDMTGDGTPAWKRWNAEQTSTQD